MIEYFVIFGTEFCRTFCRGISGLWLSILFTGQISWPTRSFRLFLPYIQECEVILNLLCTCGLTALERAILR